MQSITVTKSNFGYLLGVCHSFAVRDITYIIVTGNFMLAPPDFHRYLGNTVELNIVTWGFDLLNTNYCNFSWDTKC